MRPFAVDSRSPPAMTIMAHTKDIEHYTRERKDEPILLQILRPSIPPIPILSSCPSRNMSKTTIYQLIRMFSIIQPAKALQLWCGIQEPIRSVLYDIVPSTGSVHVADDLQDYTLNKGTKDWLLINPYYSGARRWVEPLSSIANRYDDVSGHGTAMVSKAVGGVHGVARAANLVVVRTRLNDQTQTVHLSFMNTFWSILQISDYISKKKPPRQSGH